MAGEPPLKGIRVIEFAGLAPGKGTLHLLHFPFTFLFFLYFFFFYSRWILENKELERR